MAQQARDHQLEDGPLADYGITRRRQRLPLHRPVRGRSACWSPSAIGGRRVLACVRGRRAASRHGRPATPAPPTRSGELMGAGHAHALYLRPGLARCTGSPPEVKIAAMVLFTIVVVATPREAFWAFGGVRRAASPWWRRWPGSARGWLAKRAVDRAAVRAARGRAAVRRARRAGRRGSACRCPSTGCYGAWNIFAKGTLGRARLAAAGRDHDHSRPARSAWTGCAARR